MCGKTGDLCQLFLISKLVKESWLKRITWRMPSHSHHLHRSVTLLEPLSHFLSFGWDGTDLRRRKTMTILLSVLLELKWKPERLYRDSEDGWNEKWLVFLLSGFVIASGEWKRNKSRTTLSLDFTVWLPDIRYEHCRSFYSVCLVVCWGFRARRLLGHFAPSFYSVG